MEKNRSALGGIQHAESFRDLIVGGGMHAHWDADVFHTERFHYLLFSICLRGFVTQVNHRLDPHFREFFETLAAGLGASIDVVVHGLHVLDFRKVRSRQPNWKYQHEQMQPRHGLSNKTRKPAC